MKENKEEITAAASALTGEVPVTAPDAAKVKTTAKRPVKPCKPVIMFSRFKHSTFGTILYEKGVLYFLISFFVSAGIMLYAFAENGVHPFGDQQILVVDLWHQYFPFFRIVREKLLTGGSFMYSWQNGLGSNFLSLIAYYAASPLNWLSMAFSDDHVRDAMVFILCAKIGFAGAFFSCFLRYTYKRQDFSICVFSVMYALCSYTLGYYWNVMWFDTIALFPLVMLGIVAICREHKWKTYTFALALSLISNYYIGLFTCIFSVFMFAAWGIIEISGRQWKTSLKKWSYSLWLMVRSSILGIAMGGFILLPAYYGLQLTHSAQNKFPEDTVYYEPWKDLFANLLSYSEPTKVEGLPNFACGMLAIVLAGVFLLSIGIKLREKLAAIGMLMLIAVSCNMNKLNYIWHGMHFTNQIPYRFAFIFSFVLAAAAFRAYDIMLRKGIKVYQIIVMLSGPICVFALNGFFAGESFADYFTRDGYHVTKSMKSSLIITGAFLLIFIAAKIFPFRMRAARNTFMSFALAAAVFSEFTFNAKLGVETVKTTSYNDYPKKNLDTTALLDEIDYREDSLFWRTEMTETYTLNDSALYGYYGLSQFSSAANESVTTFVKRMGLYGSEAGNRYYYRTSSPVTNMLFGIKYLIKRGGSLKSEEWALDNIRSSSLRKPDDVSNLYENRYPLSLGFMMNEEILDMEDSAGLNPFEYQNELLKKATGMGEGVFFAQQPAYIEYDTEKVNVSKNGYGNYTFRVPGSDAQAEVTYTFKGADGYHLYGYAVAADKSCSYLDIRTNGLVVDSGDIIDNRYAITFPLGNAAAGDSSSVRIQAKSGTYSGNYKMMIYALKEENFMAVYNALADEQLKITKFDDNRIEGDLSAKADGILYLSMPYEKGWKVYVDGERAETVEVCNAMMGVKVSAGDHKIKMVYYPEGFAAGVAATFGSIALTCFIIWFEKRRRLRKAAAIAAAQEAETAGDAPETAEEVVYPAEIYDQTEENTPEERKEEDEKPESDDSVSGD